MDPRFDDFEKRIAALEGKKKESTAEEKPQAAPKAAKKGTK